MIVFLAYIVFAFTLVQLLVALVNLLFETNLPGSDNFSNDLVSVLIPARNEENNISNILDDLINQDYVNIEVIVFNDQSDDKTAEIVTEYTIRDSRIRLVNSAGLPDGWVGKNFACHSLSQKASGKYLLFLDADVRIGHNLMGYAVSFSKKHDLGLISIFPKQIIKTAGERITVANMNYILRD
jgi:cellulose synthase/poly-beta-1,6-N-acetylglucosamine synthase-like glycosyltransferase